MKRLINCIVPVTNCNFACEYCYIRQVGIEKRRNPVFKYSPAYIGKAFSVQRLGGVCLFNICGNGETLLPPEIPQIVKEILKQGHYIELVTNGTLENRIHEICSIEDPALLRHLEFKFSFHYLQLKQKGLLELFFEQIRYVKSKGCSFTVELVPHDSLIPCLEEIRNICMQELGALCHVTVARDDRNDKKILTGLDREYFSRIWGQFDSAMFTFKLSTFGIKRREFCYAGDWALLADLETGETKQCYWSNVTQNIYEDISRPIRYTAVGRQCRQPHCFNSHAYMTLGIIPEFHSCTYADIRNRVNPEGTEWLGPEMKEFLSGKLYESNKEYTRKEKRITRYRNHYYFMKNIMSKIKNRILTKR